MIELVTATQRAHPDQVVVLASNHDRWFLDWLDGDDNEMTGLMSDLDLLTVKSLLESLVLAQALGHEPPNSDASDPAGEL